jgi:hypothetical protein
LIIFSEREFGEHPGTISRAGIPLVCGFDQQNSFTMLGVGLKKRGINFQSSVIQAIVAQKPPKHRVYYLGKTYLIAERCTLFAEEVT